MQKAVLLCAGRGKRMGSLTNDKPKPLVEVNGVPILENAVQKLIQANYKSLVIVIGYQAKQIIDTLKPYEDQIQITYIHNDKWDITNNIYSLWLAKEELKEDFTLLEADLFIGSTVLNTLSEVSNNNNYVLVSPLNNLMEGNCVEIDEEGKIINFDSTKNDDFTYSNNKLKTLNIYRFNSSFSQRMIKILNEEISIGNTNIYYEEVFKKLHSEEGIEFHTLTLPANTWYEIDNMYDLKIGEFQFSKENKLDILKNQHGGYWRYPITDHALIYNFHFPPDDMKKKIQSRFDDLLLNYPSSSKFIINYLSDFLNLSKEQLVLTNGVSEIIKVLPHIFEGHVGLIEPSFNEYSNSLGEKAKTFYVEELNDFTINFNRLIQFVHKEKLSAIVIVTPDNPTGKTHDKNDLLKLYNETEELDLNIIVDESFIDFSDNADDTTFLNELNLYPRITVLKSMSKTFGIGGLRLGYAASSNSLFLEKLKKEIPIWNINGFAEEFILNLTSYNEEYKESCLIVRRETDLLYEELKNINDLKVFPTDSNFILCKILDENITSNDLANYLLNNFNIYIKECSGKKMDQSEFFFRVSSRTLEDNIKLVDGITLSLKELAEKTKELNLITI